MVPFYEEHTAATAALIPWHEWRPLPWHVKAECVAWQRIHRLVDVTVQDVMGQAQEREMRAAQRRAKNSG